MRSAEGLDTLPDDPVLAGSGSAAWSNLNRRFLAAAAEDPRLRQRRAFEHVHANNCFPIYPFQSWPTFLDRQAVAGIERIAVGMGRLLKGIPARLLDNDAGRIARFYGIESIDLVRMAMEEPNGIEAAPARCDFIHTSDGLRCLEFNCGSYLGGWYTQALAPFFLSCPPIARFLTEEGVKAHHRNTVGILFRHLIADTLRRGIWSGGDFNLAIVIHPQDPARVAQHQPELYRGELRRVFDEHTPRLDGRVFLCGYGDLTERAGGLYRGGDRVHVVLEQQRSLTERFVYRSFKAGRVNLFTGPVTQVLSDKKGLALLSEHAESDAFSAEERELLARHLPWTRLVAAGQQVNFRGDRLPVDDLLLRLQDDLVLKYSRSMAGKDVFVGRFLAPAEWQAVTRRALSEPGWIVQEYVASLAYTYQEGEEGVAAHDVVWGPWDFGGRYAGSFLRIQPRSVGGVINVGQQAQVGIVLEIDEERGGAV